MPKTTHYMQPVPPIKPDRCVDCPFLGIVPEDRRKKGSKKTMICLGTMKAISKRSIYKSEKAHAGTRHLHHRPCDKKWDAWSQLQGRLLGIAVNAYNECRIPYEQQQEYEIDFDYEPTKSK